MGVHGGPGDPDPELDLRAGRVTGGAHPPDHLTPAGAGEVGGPGAGGCTGIGACWAVTGTTISAEGISQG